MSPLQWMKALLVEHVGLAKDALHIHVGLIFFIGAALIFRWPLRSWKPWMVALAAALAGEAWDLRDSVVYRTPIVPLANFHDVWNTMIWPTALLVLARTTRLFERPGPRG